MTSDHYVEEMMKRMNVLEKKIDFLEHILAWALGSAGPTTYIAVSETFHDMKGLYPEDSDGNPVDPSF